MIERAHDRVVGAEPDEEGADDRGHDAGPADRQRIEHRRQLQLRRGEYDRPEHHGGDHGHHIGLEQIRRHAGAVADIVADIVGDGRGVARIVLRDPGFDLADHVAADIGALGEDAAAQTREDRDQRGAEAERHQRVDHRAVGRPEADGPDQEAEIERDPEQRQAGDQETGDGAGLEGEVETAGQRLGGGLRHPHIGPDRDIHADEAGRSRQQRADGEADRRIAAEQRPGDDEYDDADHRNGRVLAPQIGLRSFPDGGRNLLHAGRTGIGRHQRAGRPDPVNDRERAASNDDPECCTHNKSLLWVY